VRYVVYSKRKLHLNITPRTPSYYREIKTRIWICLDLTTFASVRRDRVARRPRARPSMTRFEEGRDGGEAKEIDGQDEDEDVVADGT